MANEKVLWRKDSVRLVLTIDCAKEVADEVRDDVIRTLEDARERGLDLEFCTAEEAE